MPKTLATCFFDAAHENKHMMSINIGSPLAPWSAELLLLLNILIHNQFESLFKSTDLQHFYKRSSLIVLIT